LGEFFIAIIKYGEKQKMGASPSILFDRHVDVPRDAAAALGLAAHIRSGGKHAIVRLNARVETQCWGGY